MEPHGPRITSKKLCNSLIWHPLQDLIRPGMVEVSTEENRHVGIFGLKGIVPNMTDKGVTSDLFLFKDVRTYTRAPTRTIPDISSELTKILPSHRWRTFLSGILLLKAYLSPLLSSQYLCYCSYMFDGMFIFTVSSRFLHDVFTNFFNFLKI